MDTTTTRASTIETESGAATPEIGVGVPVGPVWSDSRDGRDGAGSRDGSGGPMSNSWQSGSMHSPMPGGPRPVPSAAAINGHPIHPMLVPLPIGALVGVLLADIAYARTNDPFWARSARHLTEAGVIAAAMAAVPGMIDFTTRPEIRERPAAWVHAGGNVAVLGLNLLSRALREQDERKAAGGTGIAISALSATILGVTGWLGGELSYRYRIGVTES
jgi:uncharacterized membrane protein